MCNNESHDLISIDNLCEMLFIGKNAASVPYTPYPKSI